MVTAVDSNLFFDLLGTDDLQRQIAAQALRRASVAGRVIISTICYAELAHRFDDASVLDTYLERLAVTVSQIDAEVAFLAGRYFRAYRVRGGPRERILADFLIAAHAQLRADRLLTRDHRFFSQHFSSLNAVNPEEL